MALQLEWNYNEFLTYVLIYAAYTDLEFSQSEKEVILGKIDKNSFNRIEEVYFQSSDYERLQIILEHKGLYYPTSTQKEELLEQIKKLFMADGDYSLLEKNLMLFLEKLL